MAAGISMTAGATDRPGEPVVRQGTGWSAVRSAIGPSAGSRARRRRATSSSEATTGSEIRRTVHIGYERSGSPRPNFGRWGRARVRSPPDHARVLGLIVAKARIPCHMPAASDWSLLHHASSFGGPEVKTLINASGRGVLPARLPKASPRTLASSRLGTPRSGNDDHCMGNPILARAPVRTFSFCVGAFAEAPTPPWFRNRAQVGDDETGPSMRPLSSTPLTRYSHSRARIFAALLADRARKWSVAELTETVPEVSTDAARTTLYLLLADRLVHESPGHRRMTFHLTEDGAEVLHHFLRQWQTESPRSGRTTRHTRTNNDPT
jgi:hypothetical protein